MNLVEKIKHFNPCEEAIEWLRDEKSQAEAWRNCNRGDWMLWLLGRLSGPPTSKSRKKLVLCCCKIARLALKHVSKGEKRPLKAIRVAEKWAKGEGVSLFDVHAAACAADAAAYAAYAANAVYAAANAAAYATYAAAYAATYAAYASANAANAAYAADAAANAAYAADAADAAVRQELLAKCADIVREFYPKPPRIKRQ